MTQERLWQPSDILPHDQDGDTPKRRGRIPQSAWPVILERYRNGATLSAIAREFDCTPSAISYIVRKAEAAVGGDDAAEGGATAEQPAAQTPSPSVDAPAGTDGDQATPAPAAATVPPPDLPPQAATTTPPAAPGERERGDRPRHERPRTERPQRDRNQQGERGQQDRPQQDRPGNQERAAGERFQSDRPQRQRPSTDFGTGERPARQDRPAGERRTLTGAAVANAVQERSSAVGGIGQSQRSYSDRLNSDRAAAEFTEQDIYSGDSDGTDRFANRPVGSEYPYRQQQRNAARQEAAETPTEPADIRLANATTRSAAAYTAWKTNPGEVGMQSLTEALHDLRKVIARMEIEMSASRKEEHAARPIPIPYHRAQRR